MFEGSRLTVWGKTLLILDIVVQGLIAMLLLKLVLLVAQYVDWAQMFSHYE